MAGERLAEAVKRATFGIEAADRAQARERR
jgi:hypothetical protein